VLLRSGRKEAALELFKSSEDSTPSAVSSAVRYEMMATAAYQSSDLRAAVQYQKLAAVEFSKKVSTICLAVAHSVSLVMKIVVPRSAT
jgi:hypothetical protein